MALTNGSITIGTSATALTGNQIPVQYDVLVKAGAGNTDKVYVGFDSGVTAGTVASTDGYQLSAGQELSVDRILARYTSDIWVIGGAASQVVYWLNRGHVESTLVTPGLDFTDSLSSGLLALL